VVYIALLPRKSCSKETTYKDHVAEVDSRNRDGSGCLEKKSCKTYLLASEHKRTLCLSAALKTLKKTGVNSSSFSEASVNSPNGPSPPCALEPFWAQTSSASSLAHLGSKGSALSKLGKEKVTSTSACQIHEAINQENQDFTSLLFKVTIIDLILFRALHFFLLLNKKRERERERGKRNKPEQQ